MSTIFSQRTYELQSPKDSAIAFFYQLNLSSANERIIRQMLR